MKKGGSIDRPFSIIPLFQVPTCSGGLRIPASLKRLRGWAQLGITACRSNQTVCITFSCGTPDLDQHQIRSTPADS